MRYDIISASIQSWKLSSWRKWGLKTSDRGLLRVMTFAKFSANKKLYMREIQLAPNSICAKISQQPTLKTREIAPTPPGLGETYIIAARNCADNIHSSGGTTPNKCPCYHHYPSQRWHAPPRIFWNMAGLGFKLFIWKLEIPVTSCSSF